MKAITVVIVMLFSLNIFGQLPQAIKYQAVARNESGAILANQQISVRVSIIDSSSSQTVYSEIHKLGTNRFGLFTIEIGRGLVPTGNFSNINWSSGNKWLKMELDPAGGNNYMMMGLSEMVSVPYAFYAGSAANGGGDSTDELQTLSISGNMLTISSGNTVTLPTGAVNTDDQNLTLTGTTLSIEDGNSVDLSVLQDGVNDADSDSTNELQSLSISGNMLTISAGNTVALPPGTVNTDDQNLSLTGTTLSIEDGNSIDLSVLQDGVDDADSDSTNELQTLSVSGDSLFISGGNSVVLQGQGDDDWVVNGNDMYNNNSGSTGVGTTSPDQSAVLDVSATDKGFLAPRMTTAQRLAIANPATGLEVFDVTAAVKMFYNGQRWLEVGADPIGTVQAFHKSLAGTPTLPWGWAECNGQTLNDPESPYNGTALPNLNSTFTSESGATSSAGLFLRGGSTSGMISTDQTNTIYQFRRNGSNSSSNGPATVPLDGSYNTGAVGYRGGNDNNGRLEMANRGVETYPGNMTVVWVIRVK